MRNQTHSDPENHFLKCFYAKTNAA